MTPETAAPLVRRIRRPDWPEEREVVLVGTAHISPDSLRLVRETIESERPDGVCIELDGDRYQALMNPEAIERLDLKQVVRERKLLPLLAGVALGAWQARMGLRLGVEPGAELREAARTADEVGAKVHLVDRQVRITLLRVWRRASFWQKVKLLAGGLESGSADEPTKEDIEELLSGDVVSRLVSELGEAFPTLKEVVIDERDTWIGEAVKAVPGGRLVVVVGAGHLDGVERTLLRSEEVSTAPLAAGSAAGEGRPDHRARHSGSHFGNAGLDVGGAGGGSGLRGRSLLDRGELDPGGAGRRAGAGASADGVWRPSCARRSPA